MKKIEKIFTALGTINNITLYFDDIDTNKANNILDLIEEYINDLDNKLSIFKDNSEISLINNNNKYIKVSNDTFKIIKLAKEYSKITYNTFDITTKPLKDIWLKYKKDNSIPNNKEIKNILKLINYKDIILNNKDMSIKLRHKGQAIDLGGIAKGYIIDKIKDILKNNNFNNALINLGGTVSSIGEYRSIGVRNPFNKNKYFATINSKDEDIITSGSYEQYYKINNKVYHHIIDPKTGYPADTDLISVTLIGNNGSILDALATSCIILGFKKSIKLIKKNKINAIFILNNGKIYITDNIKDRVNIIKGD